MKENIKSNYKYLDVELINIDENYTLLKVLKNVLYDKNKIFKVENENLTLMVNTRESINLIENHNTIILGLAPIVIESYYNIEILKLIDKINEAIEKDNKLRIMINDNITYYCLTDIVKFLGEPKKFKVKNDKTNITSDLKFIAKEKIMELYNYLNEKEL